MAKVKHHVVAILLTICAGTALQAQYAVTYRVVDSVATVTPPQLQNNFPSRDAAAAYLQALPSLLQTRGFPGASLDSLLLDSAAATAWVYYGKMYQWARLRTMPQDRDLLDAIRWPGNRFADAPFDLSNFRLWQSRILDELEENGHPFGRIYLDSFELTDPVNAVLRIDRGPEYHIDSIRIYGEGRVNLNVLERHLDIAPRSLYNKRKLEDVDRRIAELPYVEAERPSDLSLLGTGSVLNLYLKPRKTNQVSALVGLLPNPAASSKKFRVTGDANILLRNALNGGETIGLNWQQLQEKSPRLNLLYDQPYFLRSRFGFGFAFDMFRKDSSFLNLNLRLSGTYRLGRQTATVFLLRRQTIVNGIDAEKLVQTRALPPEADVSSNNLGVAYEVNSTDYRNNPRKGNELQFSASAGNRKLRRNNQVLETKDPADPSFDFGRLYDTVPLRSYQFRLQGAAAHYFPLGRQSTFKTGIQAGWFESAKVYRNELFQIGGYKLLRGFDEESQYVARYAVATLEYRLLLDRNSNFFAFSDMGFAGGHPETGNPHSYLSGGMGLSYETGAGIFNLALALGSRDDQPFNLRQSKVHLGFMSYF